MELFKEIRWLLIIVVSVSLYFPLNVPLAALAYKVQRGTRPLGMEQFPFWVRSALAAVGLTAMSYVTLLVDYYLVGLDMPADAIHIGLLLLYFPAGLWFFVMMFDLDEFGEGFNIFLLYLGLPAVVLVLMLAIGFRLPFLLPEGWILPSAA